MRSMFDRGILFNSSRSSDYFSFHRPRSRPTRYFAFCARVFSFPCVNLRHFGILMSRCCSLSLRLFKTRLFKLKKSKHFYDAILLSKIYFSLLDNKNLHEMLCLIEPPRFYLQSLYNLSCSCYSMLLRKFTTSTPQVGYFLLYWRSRDQTANNKVAHKYDFRELLTNFEDFRLKSINAWSGRRISCCARGFR